MDSKIEKKRIENLKSYQVLDTPPEVQFDEIVKLAKYICDAPIALVSFVDEKRLWFKAKVGLDIKGLPREFSFCNEAIENNTLFEVSDTHQNDKFKETPLVIDKPYIRYYAGHPLSSSEGYNLGTLCVIDHRVRRLDKNQKRALEMLAHQTVRLLEFMKANSLLKKQHQTIEDQHLQIRESTKRDTLIDASAKAAHEINNPLAIIQANVDILNSVDSERSQEILKDKLQVISANISRIITIVGEMKELSINS